jgi:hypothetical protein
MKRAGGNSSNKRIRYSTLVGLFETESIRVVDGPPLLFRVEIYRNRPDRHHFARVYRKERFRVQPTFPQDRGVPNSEPGDESIWIEDEMQNWEDLRGATVSSLLRRILETLETAIRP